MRARGRRLLSWRGTALLPSVDGGLMGLARGVWRGRVERRADLIGPAQGAQPGPGGSPDGLLDEQFLRQLERLALVARLPASGGVGGDHRSRARTSSADFADHREYVPGDDFRRIDWNVYGRLAHLYVKLGEASEHLAAYLLVDCSASMDWGAPNKLGFARALAAALGYVALARNDSVSVLCLGQQPRELPSLRGRRRAMDLLRFLNEAAPSGRVDLPACLASLRFGTRPGSRGAGQALLLSDLLAPQGLQAGLERLLEGRLDVVVVHILSPQELEPAPEGDLELVDAETGERVRAGLTLASIGRYQRRLAAWFEEVASFCSQRGIRYVRLRTDEPLEAAVLTSLRREAVLT